MSSEHQAVSMPREGALCWVEFLAHDVPKLKEFYSALFPNWDFKPNTEEYKIEDIAMVSFSGGSGLSGGIVKLPADCKREEQQNGVGTTSYFLVESIEETKPKVERLGGTMCLPKTEQGKNGWFANFRDPEGNRFGVYEVNRAN
ncbi:uncharacterized protein BDZ99DRAFT_465025 [Mytilinidion resinicola]|uniref:Glyoxalase-like domain-containing protein n=1 Tax=Mytilinidion resinicola TaxID=574789 RepID=A0A6A6YGF4_9PEZI|nr:uncharacterized protein BDZ99DRAFT_465025 [Mytilinidion resinicola]KAF2807094.1 hypothetical protein BDZ99DRAFT_465025 [Mytilinidion resinicola]